MAGPKTVFDADECQALLDLMDHIRKRVDLAGPLEGFCGSLEEGAALEKLREAGKTYLPERKK